MTSRLPADPPPDLTRLPRPVWDRLRAEYDGVFGLDQLRRHVHDHVDGAEADDLEDLVAEHCPRPERVVDVGCGFGAFTRNATRAGAAAIGIDLAPVELAHARSLGTPVVRGDAAHLPIANGWADVVTLWNVLEHVDDLDGVLDEAVRVMSPAGTLFVLAPNYASFRSEAHYHVPWVPFLRGAVAARYLRALGRDPGFWETSVRPVTAQAVRHGLAAHGLEVSPLVATSKLDHPERIRSRRARGVVDWLRRARLLPIAATAVRARSRLPLQPTIALVARKP